jgi:hypothetical protein
VFVIARSGYYVFLTILFTIKYPSSAIIRGTIIGELSLRPVCETINSRERGHEWAYA